MFDTMLFFRESAWKPRKWERENRGEDKKKKKKSLCAFKVYTYNTTIKGLSKEAAHTARAQWLFFTQWHKQCIHHPLCY